MHSGRDRASCKTRGNEKGKAASRRLVSSAAAAFPALISQRRIKKGNTLRMLSFTMRLFRTRGERRRQNILTLLAEHPDREYTVSQICAALESWAGVVGPDLLVLHRRGYVSRRMTYAEGMTWYFYQHKPQKRAVSV